MQDKIQNSWVLVSGIGCLFSVTKFSEHSHSWEATGSSACKEIPSILCTLKVDCHMHMTLPLVRVLSQMNAVCTLPFCLFKSHFIFCHILLISKHSFCFKFPQQNPVGINFLLHAWYMLCLSPLLAWKNWICSLIITEGSEINVFWFEAFPCLALLHGIGITESSAQTEGAGAAGQVSGSGSLGSEPGTVCWHISLCAEVTTELCKGA